VRCIACGTTIDVVVWRWCPECGSKVAHGEDFSDLLEGVDYAVEWAMQGPERG
jgi:hypothetical protein